jgi:predicted metalloprotease
MRWIGRRQSDNVEDRRGMTPKRVVGGGIGTLVILLIVWLLGGNPLEFLQNMPQTEQGSVSEKPADGAEDELAQFVGVVLGDTEDVWSELFRKGGNEYRAPKLVLYTDMIQSACGFSSAASGPFYCPGDEKVYIDLSFCRELQDRFEAPGDFAVAYVLAHEVGHHVQNLLGINEGDGHARQAGQGGIQPYSVAMELQADFLSGRGRTRPEATTSRAGRLEEASNAASARR